MSDKTQTPAPDPQVVIGEVVDSAQETVTAKPNLFHRAKNAIIAHKQPLLAGAGLVALVAVSAKVGRDTAPQYITQAQLDELTETPHIEVEIESNDPTIAIES